MKLLELQALYDQPFFDLLQQARDAYLEHWSNNEVQLCTLLSIKTGGCSEDCGYCAQSARYSTGVKAEKLLQHRSRARTAARSARANGSTRFCMGAAWKGVRDGEAKFEQVLATHPRSQQARHGGLRDARPALAHRGAQTQGCRRDGLQSQHRHLARNSIRPSSPRTRSRIA